VRRVSTCSSMLSVAKNLDPRMASTVFARRSCRTDVAPTFPKCPHVAPRRPTESAARPAEERQKAMQIEEADSPCQGGGRGFGSRRPLQRNGCSEAAHHGDVLRGRGMVARRKTDRWSRGADRGPRELRRPRTPATSCFGRTAVRSKTRLEFRHFKLRYVTRGVIVALALLGTAACTTSPTDNGKPASGEDMRRVVMQLRPVEAVVSRSSAAWHTTPVSCPPSGGADTACIESALTEDRVVLFLSEEPGGDKFVLGPVIADGADVSRAAANQGNAAFGTEWEVEVKLTTDASRALGVATREALSAAPPQNRIAIVVDGRLVSVPEVHAPITSGYVVLPGFDERAARRLAAHLDGHGS
jgi:SecD-like export protein